MALDLKNNLVGRERYPTILRSIPLRPCKPKDQEGYQRLNVEIRVKWGRIPPKVHHMSEAPRITEVEPKKGSKVLPHALHCRTLNKQMGNRLLCFTALTFRRKLNPFCCICASTGILSWKSRHKKTEIVGRNEWCQTFASSYRRGEVCRIASHADFVEKSPALDPVHTILSP
ncbi:UNVERIFIED_CONTAM: hypothetical protein Sangu_1719700 [Sesamum angustifolium]|uniref:Uncharacterized protein n=1 Tax=Sesamum angustifolium TaxID=2727405 RepID=A0AAW2MJR3_9LAMI